MTPIVVIQPSTANAATNLAPTPCYKCFVAPTVQDVQIVAEVTPAKAETKADNKS